MMGAMPQARSAFLQPRLDRLEQRLHQLLQSDVEFIHLINDDLVSAGGKRFRPGIVFSVFELLAGEDDRTFEQQVDLAAAVELLHSATLLHDDLIDDADLRRGHQAAFRKYGNAVSVLSGDFMLSRVLQILSELPAAITREFADTARDICEGEVLQFQTAALGDYGLERYYRIVTSKTAALLRTAATVPGMLLGLDSEGLAALRTFGLELGRAFQIQDDLLDLIADPEKLGKPVGGDLREGKVTLPLLLLFGTPAEADLRLLIDRRISQPGDLERVLALLREAGTPQEVRRQIQLHAEAASAALAAFPPSPARSALLELARSASLRVS